MINSKEHQNKEEMLYEVNFLKIEIMFLLKILNRKYKSLINHDRLKELDGYYEQFEKNNDRLDTLLLDIRKEKTAISRVCLGEENAAQGTNGGNRSQFKDLLMINKDIKALKQRFYTYMEPEVSDL